MAKAHLLSRVYTAWVRALHNAQERFRNFDARDTRMLRVGLTGGVACGKSTIGLMLAARGAHLLQADTLAHQLYLPGAPVYDAVVQAFGQDIVRSDGFIDRAALANKAFPDRIGELNAVVHPAVIAAQNAWLAEVEKADPHGVAVLEAALLIEAGAAKDFDKIIVVTCPFEQKVKHYAHRAGVSLEVARREVERRGKAQFSDEEKARHADYVIDNSGPLEATEPQVERVWDELTRAG